ncbi:non-hydrolyzing UDP-N-acetylglucosamine 2-epimerase [Halorubrum halodurans]|uniref:UDP-N-acetylglucosamine 2-epimerase (Non-hydrolyzing) n=1 Tax=Halorubrum halodurans TaxID=1383851 RepID=A0A256IGY7_9EURY|nr:UDP-N-acetylglucosamine 2-epimerase (non-hydrolyzing) [Halorubrum halodurans]OYR55799.1 UDP-N-acetylglucosamine 2-epimerase (non-hydrolyzing) [Halorubrum halodurans]
MTDIIIVLGTRPEIIKLSPVIRECERRDVDYTLLHTGQHYSDSLDTVFFEQLELPVPDYNLEVGSNSQGKQTGEMISGIEEKLLVEKPNVLVVQGDTNSVLAGAIAASKLDTEVAHVEAGLRSFDREMPEETNRVLTDHVGDYLFAPTEQSADHLLSEGIPEDRVYVVGNTVVDAVQQNSNLARQKSDILDKVDLKPGEYFLLTAHRASNVDNTSRFSSLLSGVSEAAELFEQQVIYPIHPRARNTLEEAGIELPENVRIIEPQDYLDFLTLQSETELIFTDSGGVQEEACILGIPCVTLRDSTERPETVEVGGNVLSDINSESITEKADKMYGKKGDWENPFGNGKASIKIIENISSEL